MSPLLKNKNRAGDNKYLLRKYCLLSAAFACGIMMVIFFFHDNTLAFGKNTVLRMDLYHQYGPLYAEVYDRILGGDSLIYSWTSGLGASFLGNLFNYCSSPFALVMLLFGHKNMPEAIAVMIMLKAMFAAGAFTYYINKSNNCVKKESIAFGLLYAFSGYFVAFSWNIMWFDAVAVFPLVILGIERIIQKNKPALYIAAMTYTMISNYYMAYMICILSVMYFLYFFFGRYELSSKILRAVKVESCEIEIAEASEIQTEETIVQEESVSEAVEEDSVDIEITAVEETSPEEIYTENIEESIIDNNAAVVTEKKEKRHPFKENRFWITGWTFALSSFLCFLLAAFALLPVYYCLQTSSATGGNFPEDSKQYFDIFTFIANHLPGVEATIRSSGDNVIPNVYCGLLTVMLLPFYFFSDKIKGKQKVASTILLMACLCGFVLNYFNFIWHGFHMPNDLPYRWSFAYSFFLLLIAFKAYERIDEFSKKSFIGVGFAVMCFAVLVERFEIPNCDELTILLTVIFAVLYVVILGMKKSDKYRQSAIIGLLFFTIILEIVVADAPKMTMAQPKEAYTSDYYSYQQISEEAEKDDDELFYRTELAKLRARMDPSWYGYNGVSIFSSMAYEHTAKTMEKLGLFGNNINSYTYYPQTAIFNSFFNIRYIYDNMNFLQNDDMYKKVSENEKFEAFKYNYYLPLLFSVSDSITEWDFSSSDPFTVQNELMYSATGIEDVLIPVDATSVNTENLKELSLSSVNGGTTFSVTKSANGSEGKAYVKIQPEQAGNYYIYVGSTKLSSMNIEAGGLSYFYNSTSIQPFILDLGYLEPEDEVVITYTVASANNTATLTFCAARLDDAKFSEAYDKLSSNGTFNMTSFEEISFEGTINITNDEPFIWTSIPYDESWEITLDGRLLTYTQYDKETDEITKDGDIVKIGNGLIGIKAQKGEHTVSFKYNAKGLSTGIKLTVIGLGILALAVLYKIWLRKFFEKIGFVPVVFRQPDYFND